MKKINLILLSVLTILMLFNSCDTVQKESNRSGNTHPNYSLIDIPKGKELISVTNQNSPDITQQKIQKYSDLEVVAVIGKETGSSDYTFGRISTVLTDSMKRIYVLDTIRQNIKVYSEKGKLLTILGGRGEGPGEFSGATSMAIYNDKWLLVGNRYRIEIFNIEAHIPHYDTTIMMQKNVRSLCVTSNQLFIHNIQFLNLSDSDNDRQPKFSIIHEYELPGFDYTTSFGKTYRSENPMLLENISVGKIYCDNQSESLYFLFDRMPVMKSYDVNNGKLNWINIFEDLNYSIMVELQLDGRSGIQNKVVGNYVDNIFSVISHDNNFMLVQFQRAFFDENERNLGAQYFKTLSYLIRKEDGSGIFLGKEVLPIISKSVDSFYTGNHDRILLEIRR